MKKRKVGLLGLAIVVIVAIGIIGTTLAEPITRTHNKVSAGSLEMDLMVDGSVAEETTVEDAIAPGEKIDKTVEVRNTGNQDMYIQVAVNKSWRTAEGEPDTEADLDEIKLMLNENSGWKLLEEFSDSEVTYFYYETPVKAGETTSSLMNSYSVLEENKEKNSNAYAGKQVILDFDVDAVQAVGGADAILAEWGLEADLSEDGTIISLQ